MRIEEDMKLDFKDVLFRPKRSTLRSRSEVDLNRTFTFRNSKKTWTGVPIMAANMDTVGRFEVFNVLKQFRMFTCIQKHYTKEEWREFHSKTAAADYDYLAITSGTSDKDYERLFRICGENPAIKFICIDVANGYSQHFVEYVRKVRENFPEMTIIDARGSTLPCPKRWPESAGTSDWRTAHQFSRDAATSRLESIRLDSKATESVTIRANSFTPIKTTATATDAAAADFIKNAEDFSSDTAKASL